MSQFDIVALKQLWHGTIGPESQLRDCTWWDMLNRFDYKTLTHAVNRTAEWKCQHPRISVKDIRRTMYLYCELETRKDAKSEKRDCRTRAEL